MLFISDSTGSIIATYAQEVFGNIISSAGYADNDLHLHERGQEDGYIDLYYFGARWYDPELGRWLSPEPLGFDGPNLYHFCLNDPVNGYDPDGLWTVSLSLRVLGGIGAGAGTEMSLNLDGHLNVSLSQTIYGGGISGTLTNADCVFQLNGRGTKTGFDSPYGGAAWVTNPNRDYDGVSISTPAAKIGLYGFVSNTQNVNPWKSTQDYYYGLEQSIRKLYGY